MAKSGKNQGEFFIWALFITRHEGATELQSVNYFGIFRQRVAALTKVPNFQFIKQKILNWSQRRLVPFALLK